MSEEIARADFNCALPLVRATLPFAIDRLPGVPAQVSQPLIEGMRRGEKTVGWCFTEPEAGSDMAAFATTARRDGDAWVINGCKNSISWCVADAYIVAARTFGREAGIWALSNFLIPADAPGVSPPRFWDDLGSRGSPRGIVNFQNVRIPADYLVGEPGKAYLLVAELFDTNRAFIGLKCIGAAQASVDEASEYARKREVMGHPISKFQSVSFPLAEAQTLLEAARLLCYKTLWLADRGQRHSVEGAMCKWWAPEVCFDVVRRCLLTHGHYGYSKELPLEQRLRDILGWQIGDGSAEVSKLIIARSMLGKEFVG